jgi:hypothetical protein
VAVTELPDLIASRDFSYLIELDAESVDLEEILEYAPGAAYFHAYLAAESGRADLFPPLLEIEWQNGSRFWRLLAGEALARHLLDSRDYSRAEELSASLIEAAGSDPRYRQLHIESLYWQHRDEEVLQELAGFPREARAELQEPLDLELDLFYAVSSSRLGRSGWRQKLLDLYLYQPASSFHYRAYRFIDDGFASEFKADELAFIEAVVALADGRHADAAPVLGNLLETKPVTFMTEQTIRSTYTAYRFGELAGEGARLFERLIPLEEGRTSPEEDYALHAAAALLARDVWRLSKAYQLFESALERSVSPETAERMRWYLLDTALKISTDRALELLPSIMSDWLDPDYYSDLMETIVTDLVMERRWVTILDLYADTVGRVDPYTEARLAYICGAAIREGFVAAREGRRAVSGPDEPHEMAAIFFGNSMLEASGRYYEIVGSTAAGVAPKSLDVVSAQPVGSEEYGPQETIVSGFLSYGLLDHAHDRVIERPEVIDDDLVTALAKELADRGDYFRAIRLVNRLKRRITYHSTRQNLELLYPRGYKAVIEEAAQRNDIPPQVLYALVREESYFKPDIISHAGAVGLSQLMPATAEETASRMKIELPDLTDPEGNVAIGAYYLSRQIDRFGVISNALFAYNGGPRNMNTWRRANADLPQDLLLEAVPFTETRGYGRKVLASAVAYGYLYFDVPPDETTRQFFGAYSRENTNR